MTIDIAAMVRPVKKAKHHVEKSLKMVRAKPWAELGDSAGFASFVLLGSLVVEALAFGAATTGKQSRENF